MGHFKILLINRNAFTVAKKIFRFRTIFNTQYIMLFHLKNAAYEMYDFKHKV